MSAACEVLVTMTAKSGKLPDDLVADMRRLLPIFAKQPGFLGCELLVGDDGRQVVNHLRWRTVKDHEACQQSPDFGDVSDAWGRIYGLCEIEVTTNTLVETLAAGA